VTEHSRELFAGMGAALKNEELPTREALFVAHPGLFIRDM